MRLVGRREELSVLESALQDAVDGSGCVVLVTGEPGIGKSTLAEALTERARAGGCDVRWAACREGDGAPAFWPWLQLMDTASDPATTRLFFPGAETRGFPDVDPDPDRSRFRLFDTVTRQLRAEAAGRPLVLVLDDLHWADTSSLRLLRFVARDLRGAHVLVVGTYRDVDVDPDSERGGVLAEISESGRTLWLAGLSRPEVGELVSETLGEVHVDLASVHHRTGGNPFFVTEVARLLVAQGRTAGPVPSVPEGVRSVLQRRLARISQAACDLLGVASVIGDELTLPVLQRMTGADRDEILGLLDEAVRVRLMVEAGSARFAFAHSLVRETLYNGLPLGRRMDAHRRAGEAIEAIHEPDLSLHLATLAHHFLRAGSDERGGRYAERAGMRSFDMLAYEDAAAHLRRAVDALASSPGSDERRAELLLSLGEAELASGRVQMARKTFEDAATLARLMSRPDLLARSALGLGAGLGGFEVALMDRSQVELLEEALQALGSEDSELRGWVTARLSVALSFMESDDRRRGLSEQAAAMARRIRNDRLLAYALAVLCDAIAGPDHCAQRLEHADEIIRLSITEQDPPTELLGRRLRVVALAEMGRFRDFDAEVEAYARTAERLKQPLYLWYIPLWRGMRAIMDGRLDEAERLEEQARRIGAEANSANAVVLTATQRMAIAIERGRRSQEAVELLDLVARRPELGPQAELDMIQLVADPLSDPARSRAALARVMDSVHDRPRDSEWLELLCFVADAAVGLGERDAASRLYELLQPYGSLFAVDGIAAACYGPAHHRLGVLAGFLGHADHARAHFTAAVGASAGMGLVHAHVLHDYGTFLLSQGDRREGERLLERAATARRGFGLSEPAGRQVTPDHEPVKPRARAGCMFRQEGDVWVLSDGNTAVRLRDAKGLRDLHVLLSRPGAEVHVLDLAGGNRASAEGVRQQSDTGPVVDDQARTAYQQRVRELDAEIDEADAVADITRAERARAEREALVAELSAAYGLGGRARRTGDVAERARSAVTKRLRDALARIEEAHPDLGRHLRLSVRTGVYCAYEPEHPVDWDL